MNSSGCRGTHQMSASPEYCAWSEMRHRCRNPKHRAFPLYGGRGITVCGRWNASFEAFFEDMGPRPDGTSIDRIDVNGNYEPGNCRWATPQEQNNNKRKTRRFTLNGETFTLKEWSARTGIPFTTLEHRYDDQWPPELALTLQPNKGRRRADLL